jgi:hypothetical protein
VLPAKGRLSVRVPPAPASRWPPGLLPAAKAGLSGSAGRRSGFCATGVAAPGAVALAAAADPAAAESSTSVTGTSMTLNTSAPTATGTALKDGPYK